MAEKINNQVHPDQSSADIESNTPPQAVKKSKPNKGMRRLAIVTVLVLILTSVILVFALTLLHVRNPKFQIRSVEVERLDLGDSNASLELRLDVDVSVKNPNFGGFEFDESPIKFLYEGDDVGEAVVEKRNVEARSSKKMSVEAAVEIDDEKSSTRLARDMGLGFLTLNGHGKLSGRVQLLKVIKRRRVVEVKCTIVIGFVDKVVRDLNCH